MDHSQGEAAAARGLLIGWEHNKPSYENSGPVSDEEFVRSLVVMAWCLLLLVVIVGGTFLLLLLTGPDMASLKEGVYGSDAGVTHDPEPAG